MNGSPLVYIGFLNAQTIQNNIKPFKIFRKPFCRQHMTMQGYWCMMSRWSTGWTTTMQNFHCGPPWPTSPRMPNTRTGRTPTRILGGFDQRTAWRSPSQKKGSMSTHVRSVQRWDLPKASSGQCLAGMKSTWWQSFSVSGSFKGKKQLLLVKRKSGNRQLGWN